MHGITFPGSSFDEALAPLLDVMGDLHWSIDIGAWPWDCDFDEPLAKAIEPFDTQVGLYRAGILPRFADSLKADEWSVYVGLAGTIEQASVALVRATGWLETWLWTPPAAHGAGSGPRSRRKRELLERQLAPASLRLGIGWSAPAAACTRAVAGS